MTEYGREDKREAEAGGRPENSHAVSNSDSVELVATEGSSAGDDQIGSGRSLGYARVEGRDIGGILRQLKQSMEEHLAYVDAHTMRLKARLAEDEEQRSKLLAEMSALEEEIKQLEESNNDKENI